MLRNVLYSLALLVFLGLAAVFAALNPGRVQIDFAFGSAELEKSTALISAMAVGWVFGLLCAALGVLRLIYERRKLRRALRLAEQEVQALRSLPAQDAD